MRLLLDKLITQWRDEELAEIGLPRRAALAALPVYECSDAAAWYWQTDKVLSPAKGDMGRMRPGFRRSWWEFEMPEWIWVHDGGVEHTTRERYGAMVEAIENPGRPEDIDDPPIVLSLTLFAVHHATGYVGALLSGCALCPLTEFGDWWRWRNGGTDLLFTAPAFEVDKLTRIQSAAITNISETILTGIGLSNAIGVHTDRIDVPPKVHAKRSRRAGTPTVPTYNVIRLPGARSHLPVDRPTSSGPDGGRRPPAFVRGHVKTYTADRPLFGRAVGSYWWSPRVNPDSGIQTIYSVGRKGERVLTPELPPEGDPTP